MMVLISETYGPAFFRTRAKGRAAVSHETGVLEEMMADIQEHDRSLKAKLNESKGILHQFEAQNAKLTGIIFFLVCLQGVHVVLDFAAVVGLRHYWFGH
jgi:hypothetical protein